MATAASNKRFRNGDSVRFRLGTRQVEGRVKEDRGPIGIHGRRLYLVVFDVGGEAASQIELPPDQLEHAESTFRAD